MAVADTRISLLVSPSWRLGSRVPLLLSHLPTSFPTPSILGSGRSPRHSQNTCEISRAQTREGAPSLGHQVRDQIGAYSPTPETRQSCPAWGAEEVQRGYLKRCVRDTHPSQLTPPGPPLPPLLPPLLSSLRSRALCLCKVSKVSGIVGSAGGG